MPPQRERFATTRWSIVLSARRSSAPGHQEALANLCESYWYPLYAYLRRQGHDAHAAEDHTQAFFARMLDKRDFASADPARGKFRSYLLAALKNFLANEYDRAHALKRGGGHEIVSLDLKDGEDRYIHEPADNATPEILFERAWAMTVLNQTMSNLEAAVSKCGEEKQFYLLKAFLVGDNASLSYKDAAATLGTTEGAIKVAVHRLRKRFRELLREEVAQIVNDEADIDEEIRQLIAALAF